MIWATWRQHRGAALAGAAALAVTAALIVYANAQSQLVRDTGEGLTQQVLLILGALPALVGLFIGAPLLARDLEQGTYRLVWTQGTTRGRWLAMKLLLVFGAVLGGAALVGGIMAAILHVFSARPIDAWDRFDVDGPAFVAYTVFALALGIALGAVLRRTVPAMVLTLVAFIAFRVEIGTFLRPHYMAPLRFPVERLTHITVPPTLTDAWLLDSVYLDRSGRTLSFQQVLRLTGGKGNNTDTLAAHGITGWQYYQPGDRFWAFQGIEAAIFLALAALLIGLTVYWVTRRAA